MEENIREIIKKIKKKDIDYSIGPMEEYLKGIGIMGNNMEKENFMILKKIYGEKEFGKMVKI